MKKQNGKAVSDELARDGHAKFVGQRMLPRKDVEILAGLPRSTMYEQIARGKFPSPVREPGRKRVLWVEAEIIDWAAKQIAVRDSKRSRAERRFA